MIDTATMVSSETPEMRAVRYEAMRFCDERGLDRIEDLDRIMGALTHRAYLRDIEPFIKMKVGIFSLAMPIYTLSTGDLATTNELELSDAEKNTLRQIDIMIANVAARYGVADTPVQR